MFARIRVGMTQEEAVAILRTYDWRRIDSLYAEGTTRQGRSWSGTSLLGESFANLPPPEDTARCVLTVTDDDGWEVEVVLGPGGIVSAKHISPGVWEYRLRAVARVLTHVAADAGTHLTARAALLLLALEWLLLALAWALCRRTAHESLPQVAKERSNLHGE